MPNPNNIVQQSTYAFPESNAFNTNIRVANFETAATDFRIKQRSDTIWSNRDAAALNVLSTIGVAAFSSTGLTQASPILTNLIDKSGFGVPYYSTSPLRQAYNIPGTLYNDFRSRKSNGPAGGANLNTRYDGASVLTRSPFKSRAALYLAASKIPGGVYNLFNLNAPGKFGYGWGDHGSPTAIRADFTLTSQVASRWDNTDKTWKSTISQLIPFRGDRVNVIDYKSNASLDEAYQWRRKKTGVPLPFKSKLDTTQDFIKFFLTGPKLHAGAGSDIKDDIIVFRATMDSVTDTFQPGWTPVNMIGRADPNYHYSSYSRDVSIDFTIYATDRDEMKPIYRKLNALAGYTAPDYSGNTIGLTAPWMRITIGDLFNQVPIVISSLSYTFGDADSPWEINIEKDPTMMQVTYKIQVSLGFSIISDWLPQKGGQFYSLAKSYDEFGPIQGSDNWLSDSKQQEILKNLRDAKAIADAKTKAAAKAQRDAAGETDSAAEDN